MIFLCVLVVHGLLNTFSINLVKMMGNISVWWHVVGVVIIAACCSSHRATRVASAVRSTRRLPA